METENNVIPVKQFVESAAYLLRETFEGSPEGQPSVYLDRGVGIFATLGEMSAEAASAEFHGTTVAVDPSRDDLADAVPGKRIRRPVDASGTKSHVWYQVVEEIRYNDQGPIAVAFYFGP